MSENAEKRFHSIMDKLFHALESGLHSSTSSTSGVSLSGSEKRSYESTKLGAWESNLKGDVAEGQQPSAPAGATRGSSCRPWHRSDFIQRLTTFKSISWFAKPKVVSAVNCASRGWINIDIDTIACEACGARIFFSTPASWNQQQSWMVKERHHNVAQLIHEHREKVAKKMYAASMAMSKWKNGVGSNIEQKVLENVARAEYMDVQIYGGGRVQVRTASGTLKVELQLRERTCKA